MNVDFLDKNSFVISKRDISGDADLLLIAELISMIYHRHSINTIWTVDEIRDIVNCPSIYEYKGTDGKIELRIKSLKLKFKVEFLLI